MGTATVTFAASLSALQANLALLLAAINTLSLSLKTAISQGQFTITVSVIGVSRADFDSLKTALAAFELPGSVLPLSLQYSETG